MVGRLALHVSKLTQAREEAAALHIVIDLSVHHHRANIILYIVSNLVKSLAVASI